VNYVKLDRLPPPGEWGPIINAMKNGEYFVTSGEVLISNYSIEGSGVVDNTYRLPGAMRHFAGSSASCRRAVGLNLSKQSGVSSPEPPIQTVRCCLYLRVSTQDQNCDLQRRELTEYAHRRGWEIVETTEGHFEDCPKIIPLSHAPRITNSPRPMPAGA
jgi:hypothetical protein